MTQIAQTTISQYFKGFSVQNKNKFLLKIFKYGIRVRKLTFTKTIFYENNVYTNRALAI